MKIQAINNNNQSFKALKITPEAKAIIEKQAGGAERIAKYTSELVNSKMDLTIKTLGKDSIFAYFGDRRVAAVMPAHLKDNYVMVYSGDRFGDNDDDIVDCLKFASTQRAEEVYNKLKTFSHYSNKESVNEKLDWHVYAMKLFDEAEIVPQKDSPWAMWVQDYKTTPKTNEKVNKVALEQKEEKPSFMQKLKQAWAILNKLQ